MLRGAGSAEVLAWGAGTGSASAEDASNQATPDTKPNASKGDAVTLICMANTP